LGDDNLQRDNADYERNDSGYPFLQTNFSEFGVWVSPRR
jgi:hypothetical protein